MKSILGKVSCDYTLLIMATTHLSSRHHIGWVFYLSYVKASVCLVFSSVRDILKQRHQQRIDNSRKRINP